MLSKLRLAETLKITAKMKLIMDRSIVLSSGLDGATSMINFIDSYSDAIAECVIDEINYHFSCNTIEPVTMSAIGGLSVSVDKSATLTLNSSMFSAKMADGSNISLGTKIVSFLQGEAQFVKEGGLKVKNDIKSSAGEVGDKIRNMSADRNIYNAHANPPAGGTSVRM